MSLMHTEEILQALQENPEVEEVLFDRFMQRLLRPEVQIHVLPGGAMPERKTDGSQGHDAQIRAVVSPHEMDPKNLRLRKTLFDFNRMPDDPTVRAHVHDVPSEDGHGRELVYRLDPGRIVSVGIGFITAMPFPLFYFVAPRSGLASKWGIAVVNAPGTVDSDYRGEACAVVINYNNESFDLRRGMRIIQGIFQWAVIPRFVEVPKEGDLPPTIRNAGGLGSTGLM